MKKKFKNNSSLVLHFIKGSKHYFIIAAVFAALVSLFDMISPKIISFTVDSVIGDKEAALPGVLDALVRRIGGTAFLRAHMTIIAAAVLLCGILGALCRFMFRSLNARGAETFVERARNSLYAHIMRLPYAWLGENSTGDIIQRCTSDVQTIKRFVGEQLVALVRTTILITMAISFMLSIDWRVTLGSAVFIPVIIAYSLYFHGRIGSAFEKADIEEGVLSTIAQENLTGVRVVRAFGRESYERERFEKQNVYYTNFWVHLIRLMSAFWSFGDVLTGLQILTVTVMGAAFCVEGSLSAGDYIALISYNLMLTWPVRALGRVISEMSKAGIAVERLRYIMNAEPEKEVGDVPASEGESASSMPISGEAARADGETSPLPLGGDIVFDHVSYTYQNAQEPNLKDVSFTIPAGTTLGVLGGTGSGKSTLMYLLERLYELSENEGRIPIGGRDIRTIPSSSLRQQIGFVLQEPFLFSRTLEENIGMGIRDTDGKALPKDRIRRAAAIASLDHTIESFKGGYETAVGERGMTLSGGQKQRTAIAQAIVRECPILVFDDSLSAVDAETDMKIRKALKENTSGATVILIAHRITTLMGADNIIVLDKGQIKETGTHEELLAKNGLYRRIYDLQTAGHEDFNGKGEA